MVAVYLGDLWHTNDRLTAAGDTTAPSSALGQGKLRTCGQGLGLGAKMGGGFTPLLVRQRRILRKALRDVRSASWRLCFGMAGNEVQTQSN